ncbi:uncharacterized protein BDZ99DRAFT_207447 [Mytilinidion resinicola]|uniref:Arrestin-like N-terminal domain-containing protein n=1 Tax=Mytilinidion resinicola TaxID=574789 RepID=A0A6A6Y0D4_9PEZI|nr:uncharacterized protein BDZ99DRAFT_207447 [Mytilinidion resinicola]KAF2802271.1 hypothetical protein BDZ99DRAFT_207447 [Mytilinidion resinicola]
MPSFNMKKPTPKLDAPSEVFTADDDGYNTCLSGQISVSLSCPLPSTSPSHINVFLIRIGQLKTITKVVNGLIPRNPLCFLQFKKKSDWRKFAEAEKLVEHSIHAAPTKAHLHSDGSTGGTWNFNLSIPPHLPPTTNIPLAAISYALVAEMTTADGRSIWAGQELRVLRQRVVNPSLRQCSVVTFPQSSVIVDIRFSEPVLGPRVTIPTTVGLNGLKVVTGHVETKREILREIRWEVQETGVLLFGETDGLERVPASNTSRSEYTHTISRGRGKPISRCSSEKPANRRMGSAEVEESFDVFLPKQTDLTNDTDASQTGVPHAHPVLCSGLQPSRESTASLKQWFTVQVQHKVQVRFYVGEDTFDIGTGKLVERQDVQRIYTVTCPIVMQERRAQRFVSSVDYSGEGAISPAYEADWESPPPPYVSS